MSEGISIPIDMPGAAELLRELSALRAAAIANTEALGKQSKATEETGKKSEDAAKKTHSLKDSIVDAGKAFAAGTALVGGFSVALVGMGVKVLQAAGAHEQEMRAVNALGTAYARVQQATAGTISAEEALRAQQSLTQSGLKISAQEFEAIARKARDYALATGTDTTQALEQLTDALRGGEADGLRRFGIAVDSTKSRTQNFHKATGDLIKAQKDQKIQQATLNEELGKTPKLLTSVIGGFASTITQALGLASALGKVNSSLQELADIQKRMEQDSQNMGLRDRRNALNAKIADARRLGVTDDAIGTVDTTHMSADQLAKYEKIFASFSDAADARRFTQEHGIEGTSWGNFFMEGTEGHVANTPPDALNAMIRAQMRDVGVTNADIKEEMTANDAASLARANGQETFGPPPGTHGGSGGAATGPDRADIMEQMRALTGLRARRGFAINADGTLNTDEFAQKDGESVQRYIERVSGAMEERFVDVDARLIKHRGESEFDFAKRRLELTEQTLSAIAEREKAHTERLRAEEKARGDAVIAAARQRSDPFDQALFGLKRERLSPTFGEDGLADLKSGRTSVDDIRKQIEDLQNQALAATPEDASPEAQERAKLLLDALNQKKDALMGVVNAFNEYTDAQARANNAGYQLAQGIQKSAVMTTTAAQGMAGMVTHAMESTTEAFANHFVAVVQGKESFLDALKQMTAGVLQQVAVESAKYGAFQLFQGIGNLAAFNYSGAALNFAASAGFFGLAAGAGIAAGALSTPSAVAGAAGGAGANAGAGGGRVPPSNNSRESGGGSTTVVMNYNGTSFTTTAEMEQFMGRSLSQIGRNGNVPRAFATGVFRSQGL